MELGLGLQTCFKLDTKDPVFVNFKLSDAEAKKVSDSLPKDFQLRKIKFCETDTAAEYWISYNLYELKYPKKELAHIRKVRCEINTFVEDKKGRKGIYVFCDSPYVSRETKWSFFGTICDFAERMVTFIYGCGKLTGLIYSIWPMTLTIELKDGVNDISLRHPLKADGEQERLSDDYWTYNDISFFNQGKTLDYVSVTNAFHKARFTFIPGSELGDYPFAGPFFRRAPDAVYFHRGEVSYLVNSLNRRR
jgi:hypothetical protein